LVHHRLHQKLSDAKRQEMPNLRKVIQWISAALEASRWQPPDENMFLDEQIQRGRYPVKNGDRRDSQKATG
jgi:hypothetical protein